MKGVLEDFSESALINAIEANMYASTPFPYDWPGAETYAGPEICWCITDVAFPSCNAIFNTRLDPKDVDNTIEQLLAKAKARKVPLEWWIGQDTRPSNLGERLLAHGFTHHGDGAGMAIDLLDMNEKVSVPLNFSIDEVKDIDTLKTWCHVTAVGFGMPAHAESPLHEWFRRFVEAKLPVRFYLASLDNKPVATSMYLLAEGVAGLYFVATIPEARQQGIGFAVTLKPLQVAREEGYRVGILQASPMGEPVYRRMGFKKYSVIGSYAWLDEADRQTEKEKT